jgi:hypothetical protein
MNECSECGFDITWAIQPTVGLAPVLITSNLFLVWKKRNTRFKLDAYNCQILQDSKPFALANKYGPEAHKFLMERMIT